MNDWPVLVLSLEDAEARRANLVGQLDALGLGHEIVSAVDGRSGLPERYEAMVDRAATRAALHRDMAGAEYACALSHHFIYRRVLDDGLPGAIVLEDDAVLTPLFAEFVRAGAYRAADLVVLDHWFGRVWRFSEKRIAPDIRAGRLSLVPCLTTGYSISAAGCQFMVGNSLPISRTADWPCDITRLGALATIPRVVDHPPLNPQTSLMERQRRELAATAHAPSVRRQSRDRKSGLRRWLIKRASRKIS